MKLPHMDKIQSREISAFCPSFDKVAPMNPEPLEFPLMLRDRWATSQGVDEILAMSVFSGDVDELEMPPEESNWDGSWKLGAVDGTVCVGLEKISPQEWEVPEGSDKLSSRI